MIVEKEGVRLTMDANGGVEATDGYLEDWYQMLMQHFERYVFIPYMGQKDGAFYDWILQKEGWKIIEGVHDYVD